MFSLEPNPLRDRPGKVCAVARAADGTDAFFRRDAVRAIALIVHRGLDVHLSWGSTKTLVMPVRGAAGQLRGLDMPVDGGARRRRVLLGA